MKQMVFAVHDEKVGAYMVPFFMSSKGEAVRAFSDLSTDPQTKVFRHPADYRLYLLGDFDDASGAVVSCKPEFLCCATDFINGVKKTDEVSNENC